MSYPTDDIEFLTELSARARPVALQKRLNTVISHFRDLQSALDIAKKKRNLFHWLLGQNISLVLQTGEKYDGMLIGVVGDWIILELFDGEKLALNRIAIASTELPNSFKVADYFR